MNTTVLHVFNFKCLMFQIEHRQGVEPVFAFNICCTALNASWCSSLEHVLAFKMCSMKNICVQVLHTGAFKVFNICCIVGVQIVFYTWTHVLEHMQTFSTLWSISVLPGETVQYLVFKQCSFPLNTMGFNITEHVQGVQYLLRFWRSEGVLNLNTDFYSVVFDLFCIFRENTHEQQLIQAKILYQCPSQNILDFVYGGSHFSTGVIFLRVRHVKNRPLWHFFYTWDTFFYGQGSFLYDEKWPLGRFSTGVVIRRYTGEKNNLAPILSEKNSGPDLNPRPPPPPEYQMDRALLDFRPPRLYPRMLDFDIYIYIYIYSQYL